jgi:predicted transposase/invertase (TIGR01784 family)
MLRYAGFSSKYWERYDKIFSEGKAQGRAEAKAKIAINLLKFGMGYEQVVEMTGLSIELVMQLAKESGVAKH